MQLKRPWIWLAVASFLGLSGTARGDGDGNEQAARPDAPRIVLPDTTKPPVSDPVPPGRPREQRRRRLRGLRPRLRLHAIGRRPGREPDGGMEHRRELPGRHGLGRFGGHRLDGFARIQGAPTGGHARRDVQAPRLRGLRQHVDIERARLPLGDRRGLRLNRTSGKRMSTLFLGATYGHDIAGRTGTPFSVFANVLDLVAFKAGLTSSHRLIYHRALSSETSSWRPGTVEALPVHPLFSPGHPTCLSAPRSPSSTRLRVAERPLEQLPLSRDRYALSFRVAHRFRAARRSASTSASTPIAGQLKAGDLGCALSRGCGLQVRGRTARSFSHPDAR